VSSRTPAPSRASFQIMTGLKLPGVLGLHATPVAVASQSARCVAASNVVSATYHIEVPQPREDKSSRFRLFRFRSPLLTESRSFSLPGVTEMFHFTPFGFAGL